MKTKTELRDEAALQVYPLPNAKGWRWAFCSGWNYRDQLDNEALEIAVEALKIIADNDDDGAGGYYTDAAKEALYKIESLNEKETLKETK